METLIVHPKTESQLKVLKNFLKEMQISFEKKKTPRAKELSVSKNTPNAETIKAIEEAHKERHLLKPITDIDAFFEEFKNG